MKRHIGHLNLLWKIAWDIHRKYGYQDLQDLYGEACLAYFSYIFKNFKPDKQVKFTSFLYTAVTKHLISYVIKQNKEPIQSHRTIPIEDILDLPQAPSIPPIPKQPLKETFSCGSFRMF